MASEEDERLQAEISLLEAMYPDQIEWDERSRELKYHSNQRSLQLRLPNAYLTDALPEILAANIDRADVRDQVKQHIASCSCGEEILDSIIYAFGGISETAVPPQSSANDSGAAPTAEDAGKATIIVWLHHLLNTNKRKQALSPASPYVSGLTKPGYPGVLVYSGPKGAVHDHVDDLKHQNWQAFQVRLESDEEWIFAHGSGVKEVEAMKDVVVAIGGSRKEEFMAAMRMK